MQFEQLQGQTNGPCSCFFFSCFSLRPSSPLPPCRCHLQHRSLGFSPRTPTRKYLRCNLGFSPRHDPSNDVCDGFPPLHHRKLKNFGPQSETDLINIEALYQGVQSTWDWVIQAAKFSRELPRTGTTMTIRDALADSWLICCYDLKLQTPSPRE